jgi:hypothetical protein
MCCLDVPKKKVEKPKKKKKPNIKISKEKK